MVQTRMVGSTISCLWLRQADHAGLPVMLPHESDSQVRRDGSDAAFLQLLHAIDERGRLHGVPALCRLQRHPVLARRRIDFTALDKKGQSRILTPTNAQLRRQDKSADHGPAHLVGLIAFYDTHSPVPAGASSQTLNDISSPSDSHLSRRIRKPLLIEGAFAR